MKVNKLLELYEMFEKKNIKLTTEDITNLSDLSDKVINFLLKTEIDATRLLYLLEFFSYCDEKTIGEKYLDICKEIIKAQNLDETLEITKSDQCRQSDYLYDLVKLMSCAKNKKETKEVIINNRYRSKTRLALAKIIANAKYPSQVLEVINDGDVRENCVDADIIELAKIVANAKTKEKSDRALNTAADPDVLGIGLAVELTKIVATVKDSNSAYDVASDLSVLNSGKAIELTKIVGNAKNPEHAGEVAIELAASGIKDLVEITSIMASAINYERTHELILESEVLKYPFALDIIKIMATTKNVEDVFAVAENEFVLKNKHALELVKVVYIAKNPNQTSDIICELINETEEVLKIANIVADAKNPDDACAVARDKAVIESGHVVELTEIAANAKNSDMTTTLIITPTILKSGYALEFARLIADTKYPEDTFRIARGIVTKNEEDYTKHLEVTKLIATAESSAKVKFLMALYDRIVSYDEIIFFGKLISKGINKENIDAALSMVITGNYEKSKTPHESVVSILKSKNRYVLFADAHKQNRDMAIKGLREIEKEFPKTEFDIEKTYIKSYKSKNNNKNQK